MRITEWPVAAGWLLAIAIPMQTQAQTVTGTILGTVSVILGAGAGRVVQFGLKYAF
jgi:hypothetical protein